MKRRFIVAGSLRPACAEGGLTRMRPGSARWCSLLCVPRARLGVPRARLAARRSRRDTALPGFAHGCRRGAVGVEERLARLVIEGGRDTGGHRPRELECIRWARAEQAQRGGDAPEQPVALD